MTKDVARSRTWCPNRALTYWVAEAGVRRPLSHTNDGNVEFLLDREPSHAQTYWRTGLDAWVSPGSTLLRGCWVKDSPDGEALWECERHFAARRRSDGTWPVWTWGEGDARWRYGAVPRSKEDVLRWRHLVADANAHPEDRAAARALLEGSGVLKGATSVARKDEAHQEGTGPVPDGIYAARGARKMLTIKKVTSGGDPMQLSWHSRAGTSSGVSQTKNRDVFLARAIGYKFVGGTEGSGDSVQVLVDQALMTIGGFDDGNGSQGGLRLKHLQGAVLVLRDDPDPGTGGCRAGVYNPCSVNVSVEGTQVPELPQLHENCVFRARDGASFVVKVLDTKVGDWEYHITVKRFDEDAP